MNICPIYERIVLMSHTLQYTARGSQTLLILFVFGQHRFLFKLIGNIDGIVNNCLKNVSLYNIIEGSYRPMIVALLECSHTLLTSCLSEGDFVPSQWG
jgi:hypothetical protein